MNDQQGPCPGQVPGPYPGRYLDPEYATCPPYAAYQPAVLPLARNARDMAVVALATALPALGLPLLMSPFAWGMAVRALHQIRASGGRIPGERQARTALVAGIIGTVLLVLLVLLVAFIVLATLDSSGDGGNGSDTGIDV